jgi:DNA replication protein DnaC
LVLVSVCERAAGVSIAHSVGISATAAIPAAGKNCGAGRRPGGSNGGGETMASDRRQRLHELLQQDLAELKLAQIAENYREVLDEAARNNTSMLEVLASLIASEVAARREKALLRRMQRARLPKRKTLEEYKFTFPKRIPKQSVLRLFDCEFVSQHRCAVLIGPTGTGKSHLLPALGYTACEKGIVVRFTRAIDMINTLTTAQLNGTLEKALKYYVHPALLLLDELGYLPIDKRGADLMFQVVAARYETGSMVLTTNRKFAEWGKIFDVDNTLATAMIDRLMHHGEAIVIEGESYRTKDSDS